VNALTARVIEELERHGYEIRWAEPDADCAEGSTSLRDRVVTIKRGLSPSRELWVAAHELVHIVGFEIGGKDVATNEPWVVQETSSFLAQVALGIAPENVGRITWGAEA
jgi:hypothetical protein